MIKKKMVAVAVMAVFSPVLYAQTADAQQSPPDQKSQEQKSSEQKSPEQKVQERKAEDSVDKSNSLPVSKQVMNSGKLASAQDGVTDAAKNQAGFSPTNSAGSPADSTQIRGIKVNLFANYRLNGGLQTANVMSVPADDKKNVETLMGANALMFGVASPAGIINMVTKRAPLQDVASIAVYGNSWGQLGVATDLSHRFGERKQFGIRVNASDTHLENGVAGTGGRGWFGSVGMDWDVTDRLHLQFDYEVYTKQVIEQAGISLPAAVGGVITLPKPPNPTKLLSGPWAVFNAKVENVQGRVDYDIAPGWKAMAEIGQSDGDRSRSSTRIGSYNTFTGAGGIATVSEISADYFNKFKRAELNGQFNTWSVPHNLTLGVADSQRIDETLAMNTIVLPVKQNIFDPVALPTPVPTKPNSTLPLQMDEDTGLYAYDSIGLLPRFKVLLGFRESRSTATYGNNSSSVWVPSPAAGLVYDLLPETSLFASYMRGLEDGGVAPENAKNAYQILTPAESTQYEVGIRETYFKWFQVTSSVFEITRANAVTDPFTNVFANDGVIRYKGMDAVMVQDITPEWSVTEAVEYLRAVQNPLMNQVLAGLTPENTPKWIANIGVTYRPFWVPGLSLTGRAQMIAKRPLNAEDQGYLPGYTIYAIAADYSTKIMGKHVDLRASVDNLMNKGYWNSVTTGTLGIGMNRTVRFVAKMDF